MTTRPLPHARAAFAALLMLAAAFMAGIVSPAHAQVPQNFENLDRLDSLVAMSIGAERGQPGGQIAALDRRLRLKPCPEQPLVEAGAGSFATVSCPSVGWRLRVPLAPMQGAQSAQMAPGPQMAQRYAAAPATGTIVKKGDPVQLMAGNDSFTISRMMIADEDGAAGALIRVRQEPKATPVLARVEAMGVVRVPGI